MIPDSRRYDKHHCLVLPGCFIYGSNTVTMRVLLLLLVYLVALTAIPAGLLLMIHPDGSALGLSVAVLEQSVLETFFFPGFVLTFLLGGAGLWSVFLMMSGNQRVFVVTLFTGLLVIAAVVLQLMFLPYYHWLSVVYLLLGFMISILSYQLMGKAAF